MGGPRRRGPPAFLLHNWARVLRKLTLLLFCCAAAAVLLPGHASASDPCGRPQRPTNWIDFGSTALTDTLARPGTILAVSTGEYPALIRQHGAVTIYWDMYLNKLRVGTPTVPFEPETAIARANRLFEYAAQQSSCSTPLTVVRIRERVDRRAALKAKSFWTSRGPFGPRSRVGEGVMTLATRTDAVSIRKSNARRRTRSTASSVGLSHPAALLMMTTVALLGLGLVMVLSASSVSSFAEYGSSFFVFNLHQLFKSVMIPSISRRISPYTFTSTNKRLKKNKNLILNLFKNCFMIGK